MSQNGIVRWGPGWTGGNCAPGIPEPDALGAAPRPASLAPLPEPYAPSELRSGLWNPIRWVDLILVSPKRLAATVSNHVEIALLTVIMLVVSVVMALPFGAVLGWARTWQIAALFLGSLLICFPSLHVFSAFLGCKVSLAQSLVLALIVSSVASVFTLGFAPILWFLKTTMVQGGNDLAPGEIAVVLLSTSMIAGVVHLARCIAGHPALRPSRAYPWLLTGWVGLLTFITYRMARALELLP